MITRANVASRSRYRAHEGSSQNTSMFDTNPGWMPNGRFRTTDHRNYGMLDTTGVITKSSNVGAAKIVAKVPNQEYYEFLKRFGYGHKTNSGFPGESSGVLAPPSRWSGTTKQTMSYGYGLSVTPLQLAQAYAVLGSGGSGSVPAGASSAMILRVVARSARCASVSVRAAVRCAI